MHCSLGCLLPGGMSAPGEVFAPGGSAPEGGVLARGGSVPRGDLLRGDGIPACSEADRACKQNHRHV